MKIVEVMVATIKGQVKGRIEFSSEKPFPVSLHLFEERYTHESGESLFDSFLSLRRAAEAYDWKILCSGARKDAYPSPRAREGGGRLVYLLVTGQPATELVDMFSPASANLIVTVEEQEAFYNLWLGSLGWS